MLVFVQFNTVINGLYKCIENILFKFANNRKIRIAKYSVTESGFGQSKNVKFKKDNAIF